MFQPIIHDEHEILEELRKINKVGSNLNQIARHLNQGNNREGASERLDELIAFYKDCDLQIFREFAALLSKYHDSIVNSFRYVTASESGRYANKLRRLSNGPMESFNNIPSGYRTQSHGIDDFEFTRNRILWSYRKDAPILAVPKSAAEVHNYTGKKRGAYKKGKH